MKTYYNATKTKRIWYNQNIKTWTLQHIDVDGNQIANAEYCHLKTTAFKWLADANNYLTQIK